MNIHEWQWLIFGIGILFCSLPILSFYNMKLGLIIGVIIMWFMTIISLSSFSELLKELGLGI